MKRRLKSHYVIFIFLICLNIKLTGSISCFVCTSYNHDNPNCEDPFLRSDNVKLEEECFTGVPGKNGSYRASHCIKLVAHGYGYTYFIRTCSLDLLSGKEDQELVRVNHCGYIALKNFYGFDKLFSMNETFYNRSVNLPIISRLEGSTFFNAAKFRGCLSICASNECNKSSNGLVFLINKKSLRILVFYIFFNIILLLK